MSPRSEAGSSSSLSAPPASNAGGGNSNFGSQDASITGSGAEPASPSFAAQLRGGRPTTRSQRAKVQSDDGGADESPSVKNPDADTGEGSHKRASHKRKASTQDQGASPKAPRVALRRQAKSKKWEAPFVLTNSNSPLVANGQHNDLFVSGPCTRFP